MNCYVAQPVPHEPMMLPTDFAKVGGNMTALIQGVMEANLRAMQELTRAQTPQAFAEVQRRSPANTWRPCRMGVMTLISGCRKVP
jgi:hypothetical protein